MKRTCLLLGCLLAGCHQTREPAGAGGPFDPVQFFTGHSSGEAKLHLITGSTRQVTVDSMGTPDARGGLVLDQAISEERKAPRVRRWVLRPNGTNHWKGTLTDAKGPVDVERTPVDVVIRYRMKSGPQVEQHLKLASPGIADNHMSVTRFGVEVATLDERIRKLPR
jgi:uncharacterized protein DUF3833